MNAPTMTVARYLIQRLSQLGAEHLFAVPGDYAGDFLLAVDQDGAVQRVGTCNELEAGYAADAYARCAALAPSPSPTASGRSVSSMPWPAPSWSVSPSSPSSGARAPRSGG